jgi:hypothetical protein
MFFTFLFVGMFICGSFNDVGSFLERILSYGWIILEWTARSVEGSDRSTILYTVQEFTWKSSGKIQRISVRIVGVPL